MTNPIRPFTCTLKVKSSNDIATGKGTGILHMHTGEIKVEHVYDRSLATFDFGFLPSVALTGTPAPKFGFGEFVNPFADADTFSFTRTVEFSGYSDSFSTHCKYSKDHHGNLHGEFSIEGTTPPSLDPSTVEPTIESWTPTSKKGVIDGIFSMNWRTKSGGVVGALVKTIYDVSGSPSLEEFKNKHFRYITIQSQLAGLQYSQKEQITIFSKLPGHIESNRNI